MTASSTAASQTRILLAAVFLAYFAQMTLNPIIAPLAREVGLAEWQIGATISVAALMVVLTSSLWGRRSQSWGRKPVLVAAFTLALITAAFFAVVSGLGMVGAVTGTVLFLLFMLLRGIGFGTAIAAVQPTAQAYIADLTTTESERVKGMAGIGAAQGVAMIAGAVTGGALAGFGLMASLTAVPVILGTGLIVIIVFLRRQKTTDLIDRPRPVRVTDPRLWPFLVAGFGIFTSIGFIQIVTGFIVQDRMGLNGEQTGMFTGVALLTSGVGMLVSQGVIVPRIGWSPPMLIRVGCTIGFIAFAVYAIDLGGVGIIGVCVGIGVGLGMAMPGFTAGATMNVERDEQGSVAGLVGATGGFSFIAAPIVSTVLYGLWPPLPVIVGAVLLALVTVFVRLHPLFRQPSVSSTPLN